MINNLTQMTQCFIIIKDSSAGRSMSLSIRYLVQLVSYGAAYIK